MEVTILEPGLTSRELGGEGGRGSHSHLVKREMHLKILHHKEELALSLVPSALIDGKGYVLKEGKGVVNLTA